MQFIPPLLQWNRRRKGRVLLPFSDGRRVRISPAIAASCSILANRASGLLSLRVRHSRDVITGNPAHTAADGFVNDVGQQHTEITGNEARRALSRLMPAVNADGARE